MAKMKIKTITHNGKWTNIEFDNGQKASADNEKEPKFKELQDGQEVDLDIKHWKDDKYFANFPKAAGAGSKFAAKDYTFDKRNASLLAAIDCFKYNGVKCETDKVIQVAEKYYEYLNKK